MIMSKSTMRQATMIYSLILIGIVAVVAVVAPLVGKDISSSSTIISTMMTALSALGIGNYFSKPSGED